MEGTLHLEGNELEIKGATKVVSSTQNQAVVETKNEQVIILGNEIEVKDNGDGTQSRRRSCLFDWQIFGCQIFICSGTKTTFVEKNF